MQPPDPDWWRGAVIYQIYTRSFRDASGDGVGDLQGIIDRLPHVASLGVDAIWVSPFNPSPMLDFGYDVSDYRDVDPVFGSLDDFAALVDRAHELGLRVLIDLVLSHSSDRHPWFRESRSSRDNPRADWYVWADPAPDGTPPNNWLAVFGGPAWEWEAARQQYYLHNFLVEQPDLNLHHPEVQQQMLDVVRFWLQRGVDGFRLDVINFYFHDRELRNNPVLPPEARNDSIAPVGNPYNWQDHRYDKNQPENLEFLRSLRALVEDWPGRTMVGEVGDAQRGLEIMAAYTSGGDRLHMCYDFTFLSPTRPDAGGIADSLRQFEAVAGDGWPCWAFSNHDVVRHPSRWSLGEPACRLYASLLMSLRGSVSLYQGEELGLEEAEVAFADLQDPYGIRFWPRHKGRDGCRTPMPWTGDAPLGGFSEGRPWLPLAADHLPRSVAAQEADGESMLHFYRRLIAFRKAHPVLRTGELEVVGAGEETLCLLRHPGAGRGDGRMLCAFNLGAGEQTVTLPGGDWTEAAGAPFAARAAGGQVVLPAFHAWFGTAGNAEGAAAREEKTWPT